MKLLLAVLASLTLATSARGQYYTATFAGSQYAPVGTVSGNGITMTFGDLWAIVKDHNTPPSDQHPNHLEGDFENEPSAPSAASFNYNYSDRFIHVSPPVRYISFWWTAELWHCGSTGIPGQYFQVPGSSPMVLDADNGLYQWPINGAWTPAVSGRGVECYGTPYAPGSGGAGCTPSSDFCQWYFFERIAPSPVSIISIQPHFATDFYVDNLTVNVAPNAPSGGGGCSPTPCRLSAPRMGAQQPKQEPTTSWGRIKVIYR